MTCENYNLVKKLLKKVDNDFKPPLSSILDIDEYSKKIILKSTLFTRVKEGELIGLCAIYITDKESCQAYLTMLAVDPIFRGLGLAKGLIAEMEFYVLRQGLTSIKLEVHKNNPGAFSMYRGLGYEIIEESSTSYFLQKKLSRDI
ncbi:GNAT family N-acetyltransferase [Vibrio fluvialis]|uniref:GNAT family N-acetyltransferase n=1 Tax=Vibrio fluvialis TaxID=676 RepID=UPI001EEC717A|nr:GNAT family N-acetyltransferase [Vibrio fluvialis]MCG6368826.1 GNAT family N-acetyltransferase [Vibrio fluvialis]MCG6375963.1 GNAT family N-acetyltransferase [Vibrio fluvialis]